MALKAQYTAYHDTMRSANGTYPNENTCAAPPEIPFGTKIKVSVTCTIEGLDSNSNISVYADVPGVGYTDIVVDCDNVTVTFEEQKQDIRVKVVVADGMV